MPINVEIKVKSLDVGARSKIRVILKEKGAEFLGIDNQTDTYFIVTNGRLKLRESNIENNLIFYERENQASPKESKVILFENNPTSPLKSILEKSLEILVVVNKTREIYFIGNVRFHIDRVADLGWFIEIEAIDHGGTIGKEKLYKQCREYMDLFGIAEEDLIEKSYSDMLLSLKT